MNELDGYEGIESSVTIEEMREFTQTAIEAMAAHGLPSRFISWLFWQAMTGAQAEHLGILYRSACQNPTGSLGVYNECMEIHQEAIGNSRYSALAVAMSVLQIELSKKGEDRAHPEKDIENKFYNNLATYLPGAVKTSPPLANTPKKPDGFVMLDGRVLPVEVKAKRFGRSALGQLQEYMTLFKCLKGVAVAPKLGVTLPKNVIFVSVEPDEDNVIKFPIH